MVGPGGDHVRTAVHRGQAAPLLGRDAEGRVGHAQRLEQALAQEIAERSAGDDLDHPGGDVDADAVAPARPRLEGERKAREIVDRRLQRALGVEQLGRVVHLADGRILDEMVGETAHMGHQVADHDRATGSDQTPSASRTFTAPKAGMYFASGSISRKRPSSSSVMSAVQTIGLVIE